MVKFGKKLKLSMIHEWQNEYISYKSLKRYIREALVMIEETPAEQTVINVMDDGNIENNTIFSKNTNTENYINYQNDENNENNGNNEVIIPTPTVSIVSPCPILDFNFENIYKKTNGSILKNFIEKIDKEIHKVYLFYSTIERELYLQINTLLHRRPSYSTFTQKDIYKELDSLVKVSHITKSFCAYINDNMMAVKKILKKFDKKFNKYFKYITINYLKSKLEQQNSDFNYMLQYKIIDEANALIEDMMKDLRRQYNLKLRCQPGNIRVSDNSIDLRKGDNDGSNKDSLIGSNFSFNNSSISVIGVSKTEQADLKVLKIKIRKKIIELENYLRGLDETVTFRSKIKDWNYYIKNGYTIINNHISIYSQQVEALRSMLIPHNEDEEVWKKFVSSRDRSKLYYHEVLSKENKSNIILSLMHTFLYMFIYSMCSSTNSSYLKEIDSEETFSGVIMGLTPLAAILSTMLLSKWSNHSFSHPMIFSLVCFILGSFLYAFAYNFKSALMIGLGRFLIGLGSARTVNRRYLIQFIPKNLITKYSFYYVLSGAIGLGCGPLFSFFILYFDRIDNVISLLSFNLYTYPGWLGLLISIILLVLVLIGYTEPLSNSFQVYESDNINGNMNGNGNGNGNSEKVISKEDKIMINEIDNKLHEINIQNNFTDSNLVQYNIENIKIKQKNGFSYIYKCFLILFLILFTIRVCNESLFIIFPYYLLQKEYSFHFVSLYMSGSLLMIIPSSILFKKLHLKYPRERKILIYLLIIVFLTSLVIIDYFFPSTYKFFICTTILLIVTNLIESLSSSLMAKIIPPDWEMGTIKAGLLITISTTSGRTIGSFIQTLSFLIGGKDNIILITYSFCSFLFFIIIILFIFFYSELRVKSLARILKNLSLNRV